MASRDRQWSDYSSPPTHIIRRSVHGQGTQSSEGCSLARTRRRSVLFALAVSLSTPTCGSSILCFPVHFLCLVASPPFPPLFSFNRAFKQTQNVGVYIYIYIYIYIYTHTHIHTHTHTHTRWFKYDRDWCRQIYTQISPGHIWTTLYICSAAPVQTEQCFLEGCQVSPVRPSNSDIEM